MVSGEDLNRQKAMASALRVDISEADDSARVEILNIGSVDETLVRGYSETREFTASSPTVRSFPEEGPEATHSPGRATHVTSLPVHWGICCSGDCKLSHTV